MFHFFYYSRDLQHVPSSVIVRSPQEAVDYPPPSLHFWDRLGLGYFRILTGLSSWEVRCSQGPLTLMKDGLMGLVTCRSALKPHSHSTNHQRLMSGSERDAAGPSWSEVGSSYNQGTVRTQDDSVVQRALKVSFKFPQYWHVGHFESLESDRTKGEEGCQSWDLKRWAVRSAYILKRNLKKVWIVCCFKSSLPFSEPMTSLANNAHQRYWFKMAFHVNIESVWKE